MPELPATDKRITLMTSVQVHDVITARHKAGTLRNREAAVQREAARAKA